MTDNVRARLAELPGFLSAHLTLTIAALGLALAIGLPLAILLVRRPRFRYPVLTAAGVIQTVPALALLALMVPVLAGLRSLGVPWIEAFAFWPAFLALTLYALLPILRNAVTGIVGVAPDLIEAGRGMGMTDRQILWRVQVPLALPILVAGVRTATVWTVGMATLATPVGQTCLGNYIFTGLQTRNVTMVIFGVVSAAVLAIALDLLVAGLERASSERRPRLGAATGAALAALVATGLAAPHLVRKATVDRGERAPEREVREVGAIRVGTKGFTESHILGALVERVLGEAGYETDRRPGLGSAVAFDALVQGDSDVYVDYSGTVWANYMRRERPVAPWRVLIEVDAWLVLEHGVRDLGPLGFENAYALAMRREQAQALGVRTIADLARHASDLAIGADFEFLGRPEWAGIRSAYGLSFGREAVFDHTLLYEAAARGEVDVISAYSSDGRIAAFDLVTLGDPAGAIPPYHAILLLGPRIARDEGVARALSAMVRAIDVEEMRRANHLVDRDEDPLTVEAAAAWLDEEALGSPVR